MVAMRLPTNVTLKKTCHTEMNVPQFSIIKCQPPFCLGSYQTCFETMDINTISFLVFISILAVVGIVGNSLIIAAYYSNVRKLFNRYYIVALSITDLVVNLLIIPYTAIFELHDVTSDVVCHGMEVIRHTIIGFSNLILVLIACERLLLIWKPTKFISEKKKLGAILATLGVSVIIGIPSGAVYEVTDRAFDVEKHLNITGTGEPFCQYTFDILGEKMRMERYSINGSAKSSSRIVKGIESSQTASSVLSYESTDDQQLSTCPKATKNGTNDAMLNTKSQFDNRNEGGQESETDFSSANISHLEKSPRKINRIQATKTVSFDTDTSCTTGNESEAERQTGTATKRRRCKHKSSKSSQAVRRKTWTMFFICTAVYILCWIPFFLEIFNVTRVLVLRYFFLIGHATNPIIYSVVNIKVRNAIQRLFRRRRGI
uniref:G-protein coupled receptors family 1 profile domain-containing protein n=1 Tax=Magallana gigas TaxID=29159 RepID=A0A8W8MGK7_MAGGI